jgi:hypothetical protein
VAQEILVATTSLQKWIHPIGCIIWHFYFLGSASQQQKHNTIDILRPAWHSSLPHVTTHFIPISNFLIKKSNHQKIQEHAPGEWDLEHFYFLGAASQQQKTQLSKTNDISHPP